MCETHHFALSTLHPNAQVREYVMDEYLGLYVVAEDGANASTIVQLLAIKHQRQLGFDVRALD
ncbi:MAG: hypothetical protein JWQ73_279 [Variovorax sp.]|nr:hypothetical protein [Variovorax sp.]